MNTHTWLDFMDHQHAGCAIKHPFWDLQRARKLLDINNTAEYGAVYFVDSLLYPNAFTETPMPSIVNLSIFGYMGFGLPGCTTPNGLIHRWVIGLQRPKPSQYNLINFNHQLQCSKLKILSQEMDQNISQVNGGLKDLIIGGCVTLVPMIFVRSCANLVHHHTSSPVAMVTN